MFSVVHIIEYSRQITVLYTYICIYIYIYIIYIYIYIYIATIKRRDSAVYWITDLVTTDTVFRSQPNLSEIFMKKRL